MAGNVFDHLRVANQRIGYFGPVTSTIDWCELNYTHSYYIAEFVNTLSNIPSLIVAPIAAYIQSRRAGVPARYAGIYLGSAGVGIGSFAFHGTLTWEMQLLDELPMLFSASYAAYIALETSPGTDDRFGTAGIATLIAVNVFSALLYIAIPYPVYFEAWFALLMFTGIFRGVYLLRYIPQNHINRRLAGQMLSRGFAICLLAFGIWNVDNYYCAYLRETRAKLEQAGVGALGHLTQGHGWWHLLMGWGIYLLDTAYILIGLSIKTSPDDWDVKGYSLFPLTVPASKAAAAEKKM